MNHQSIPKAIGIYQIKNVDNGYSYIGSAANLRKRCVQHIWDLEVKRHSNPYMQKVWNKHGSDVFEFYVLEELIDCKRLLEREQFFMDILLPEYNVCPIAGSAKGRVPTAEHRERLRQAGLGKKYGPERCANIREGRLRSLEARPELREIARRNQTGKKMSDATKLKHSETMRRLLQENPRKFRIKPVQQFSLNGELLATFSDTHKAASSVNGNAAAIQRCCLGNSKTSAGYRWKYVE